MKENLLAKVTRRLKTLIGLKIPFNQHYRPSGVYPRMADLLKAPAGQGGAYQELYPAHVSAFKLSSEFSAVCSDYVRPEPTVNMPAAYVAAVPNARVFLNLFQSNVAVISADNKVVGQASYQYLGNGVHSDDPADNLVFKQKYFPRPKRLKGTVFSLLSGYAAIDYFFHWMNDSLPKLKLLKESGWLEKTDYFLVPSYKYAYQKETLRTLGIRDEQVIDATKHAHLEADTVITALAPRNGAHVPVWVYDFYRHDFLQNYRSDTVYPPCVYISRKDAQFRNVDNEQDLLALLQPYGFQAYTLTSMPFAEQAKLFASAKVIVAPHGAGLNNLVFCKEGTKVVEFFAGGYVKPTFHNLANKSGLAHHFLVFGLKSAAANTTQGVPLNITVDLAHMKALLDKVMVTGNCKALI